MNAPTTLFEAITLFSDPKLAHDFVVKLRWPNGVTCPREDCGSDRVQFISTRRLWRCKGCGRQFTAKVGTIFEDSAIGFDKWLPAMWLLSSNKNGVSSLELHRALGVTQKTAWFMLHRIRTAMQTPTYRRLTGTVEVDETFVGASPRGNHPGRVIGRRSLGPRAGKTVVMGMVERQGEARAMVVPDTKRATLVPKIRESVEPGSRVVTDALRSYDTLGREFPHDVINHAEGFARGDISTNGIENFWSGLKRTLAGTYISVRPKHLDRYVVEQEFRFNSRTEVDGTRFAQAVRQAEGKRLTYRALTKGGSVA
jgi:transposase-like protein